MEAAKAPAGTGQEVEARSALVMAVAWMVVAVWQAARGGMGCRNTVRNRRSDSSCLCRQRYSRGHRMGRLQDVAESNARRNSMATAASMTVAV